MNDKYLNLYLEIKSSHFIFYVEETDNHNTSKIKYKLEVPAIGVEENKIYNLEKVFDTIKKNIYLVEQNQKCTFKEIVLILNNFKTSFHRETG